MRTLKVFLLIAALTAAVPACQGPVNVIVQTQADWMRTELYFGLTRRDRSPISDADFQKFVDTAITSEFPDGFTITPAAGQYMDSKNELHKEPSRVLTVLYKIKDAPDVAMKIRRITDTYCRDFDQESVLRTTTLTNADFSTQQPSATQPAAASQPVAVP